MPLFLGRQCPFSFDDKTKTPFLGTKAMLTRGVCAARFCFFVFFFKLEEMYP